MNFDTWFTARQPKIPMRSAEAVLKLAADGATVPFIARYRKEQTGNLDEVAIQAVIDSNERWQETLKRQQHIVAEIEKQGKLTPELKERILTTFTLETLEDIYLPYKKKRKTKAALAREAGLEPLADWIWNCGHGVETPQPGQTLELWAFTFRNEEKGITDAEAAIAGAQDILVERLSEMQELRQRVREATFQKGHLVSRKGAKAKPHSKFENYFEFNESIAKLREPQNSHRYLALRRGWMEEELTLAMGGKPEPDSGDGGFEGELLQAFQSAACGVADSPGAEVLARAARLALKAHVQPAIETEVHKALKDVADNAAIHVFVENVRELLLAAPLGAKAVLGVDPGVRTGCKLAVVDDSGKYIASTVIHLQTEAERQKARTVLVEAVNSGSIRAISVGNGTYGREAESFIREALRSAGMESIPVVMVSESGASIYSASEVAREEFPDLDLTVRGAISIARRLQDPLAELVKIDPRSIGVGQYQHDVGEHALKKSLDQVVESCVNQVGVDLNTASSHLLSRVAGIGPALARAVVEQRSKRGLFRSRRELLDVPRFSGKAFEQAAGFLRVRDGEHPLDNTGVHPERYALLEARAASLGKTLLDLMGAGATELRKDREFQEQVGEFTFRDILTELEKPGRDPREGFVPFQFREDIRELKDLKPGMTCPGIVTNVTNFGAFVDIGVHQDGLVHISQLSERYVKDPREVVSPGDHVQVRVLEVNAEKHQISLSMKPGSPERRSATAPSDGKASVQLKPRAATPRKNPAKKSPEPVFNNAFAGLASLRNELKPRK